MVNPPDGKLTRIGVFYDGGYFAEVSDYYRFRHERASRLSIQGLHEFIRSQVGNEERVDPRYCQIVDAHYFRGRFSAEESEQSGRLKGERIFDDLLMRSGVVTHYLPRTTQGEKGIDVWLALEAFELAVFKRFHVLVLVACDGDYLPLVRKLNTLGTRVMLLAWDFEYMDDFGRKRTTRTAQVLLNEVTYPVMMHSLIDDRRLRNDPVIKNLFVPSQPEFVPPSPPPDQEAQPVPRPRPAVPAQAPAIPWDTEAIRKGVIQDLKAGYGFITEEAEQRRTWFFPAASVVGEGFWSLRPGDPIEFRVGPNPKRPGESMAVDIRKVSRQPMEPAPAATASNGHGMDEDEDEDRQPQ